MAKQTFVLLKIAPSKQARTCLTCPRNAMIASALCTSLQMSSAWESLRLSRASVTSSVSIPCKNTRSTFSESSCSANATLEAMLMLLLLLLPSLLMLLALPLASGAGCAGGGWTPQDRCGCCGNGSLCRILGVLRLTSSHGLQRRFECDCNREEGRQVTVQWSNIRCQGMKQNEVSEDESEGYYLVGAARGSASASS